MALYGVTITKNMLWQGKQEEFDNTYYYEGPAEPPDAAGLTQFLTEIARLERAAHGVRVAFVKARIWSAGGTIAQNVTLALIDLTGVGDAIGAPLFGEAAVVLEWPCDRLNIKGRKVYLRKFYRPGNAVAGMTADTSRGETPLTSAQKAHFKGIGDALQTVAMPAGVNWQLKSRAGRLPKANNNSNCNDFLRSREFRRN